MHLISLPDFELTGLHIHTTWQQLQAKTDLAKLWRRFYAEDVAEQLNFSVSDDVYVVYTDYQQNGEEKLSIWLGLQTLSDDPLPVGLRRLKVPSLNYWHFTAASELQEDINQLWQEIHLKNEQWQRNHQFDLEVHSDTEPAQIFISTHQLPTAD